MIERMRGIAATQRWLTDVVHAAIFVAAAITVFLLRFEFQIPEWQVHNLVAAISVCAAIKTVVFVILKLDRGLWRYVSIPDLTKLGAANLAGSVGVFLSLYFARPTFPRSFYLLDLFVCLLYTGGARLFARIISESATRKGADARRCLIYGGGGTGLALLREIRQNPSLPYHVCGFVDDAPRRVGTTVQGLPILSDGAKLADTARKHDIGHVLIAMPSASSAQIIQALEQCNAAGITCKIIPGMAEVIEGRGLTRQIRDVAVEDLLGRSPVHLDLVPIQARIQNRVVLITGAAGSIGSELCRQIAMFRPAAIVAYEIGESPLFHLKLEINRIFPDVPFYAEIGSIQNRRRLSEVFERYSPSVVYHAAAYKHVPLMEANTFEAIDNNVFGTLNVALAAAGRGVEEFVMISSDKAVHPTSVMGATKRLAELVIRSLQNGGVRFVSVRFGNVLGSNGSVVQIFKEQIARGGPITVTHPDMRRYFMTIPEACQLVLQASTMAQGGEIFVLDMGEPVQIVDLARNLILLSGLRPDEDIKIQFTGVRPGEKLYEELSLYEENILPTNHSKINLFASTPLAWPVMERHLAELRRACDERELNELILTLKEIIPDYNPSRDLLSRALRPARRGMSRAVEAEPASPPLRNDPRTSNVNQRR